MANPEHVEVVQRGKEVSRRGAAVLYRRRAPSATRRVLLGPPGER